MLGRSVCPRQIVRGIDQSDVRERLRKVSDLASGSGIIFFCQQSNIVAQAQQPLKHRPSVFIATLQDVIVGKPKAASKKGAFVPGQTVDFALGILARHKAIPQQKVFDGRHGSHDPGVISWQEADQRQEQ
jgi:hypothetical protein